MILNLFRILDFGFLVAIGLFFLGGAGGCGDVIATGEPGVFVPNVKGTYDLVAVTESEICTPQYDTAVQVLQDEENIILRSTNDGFDDYSGTIDSEGALTLIGAGTECTGTFVGGVLAAVCNVLVKVCEIDPDTGEETCSDEEFSCSVSYARR
jgi:hypothetical protein